MTAMCIIACETVKDELEYSIKECGKSFDILWIESGLHNTPNKLTIRLQEELDQIDGCERVLLCFGTCGNAVLGLKTGRFELIMPRVDDCISLLFGSVKARRDYDKEAAAYYLTEGWLRGERNLLVEYDYSVEKYGAEQAKEIADMMYGHYRTMALFEPINGDVTDLLKATENLSSILELQQKVLSPSVSYITDLLSGPWSEDKFIIKAPFTTIEADDIYL